MPTPEERSIAVEYLLGKDTPLLAIAELGELIGDFLVHLQCNEPALLRTGKCRISFRRSWWLHSTLTNLYYTKLPNAMQGRQLKAAIKESPTISDPCGKHSPFDWIEANCYHYNSSENCQAFNGISSPECGYDESGYLPGLEPHDISRLEEGRFKFFNLKVNILTIVRDALAKRDGNRLWSNCLNAMTASLSAEEAEFYLKMDRYYLNYDFLTGEEAEDDDDEETERGGLIPGGFTDLLEVIGYCENELFVGAMHNCKISMMGRGDIFQGEFGSLDWKQTKVDPSHEHLESVIDQYIESSSREPDFWREYRDRVNTALQNEFYDEVIVNIKVKRKFTETFTPNIRSYGEMAKIMQEDSGRLPTLTVNASELKNPAPETIFRKTGDYWQITFDGQAFQEKDTKGMKYISHLLKRPNEDITAIDLFYQVNPVIEQTQDTELKGQMLDDGLSISGLGDAGEIIDRQSIEAYKIELKDKYGELEEAKRDNNISLSDRIRGDIEFFEDELKRAHGLTSRIRKASDVSDNPRKSVSAALKRAIYNISKTCPPLGRHLNHSINMGRIMSYTPEILIDWSA